MAFGWRRRAMTRSASISLAEELSQLSTKFSNNVLDATKAFRKLVTDKDVVAGLPPSALALAAQQVPLPVSGHVSHGTLAA